jgi:hypothetical protein
VEEADERTAAFVKARAVQIGAMAAQFEAEVEEAARA